MWKRYKHENAIYERANFRIVLVDDSSPKYLRVRAMNVGSLANEERSYDGGVYNEYEQRVKVLIGVVK